MVIVGTQLGSGLNYINQRRSRVSGILPNGEKKYYFGITVTLLPFILNFTNPVNSKELKVSSKSLER